MGKIVMNPSRTDHNHAKAKYITTVNTFHATYINVKKTYRGYFRYKQYNSWIYTCAGNSAAYIIELNMVPYNKKSPFIVELHYLGWSATQICARIYVVLFPFTNRSMII